MRHTPKQSNIFLFYFLTFCLQYHRYSNKMILTFHYRARVYLNSSNHSYSADRKGLGRWQLSFVVVVVTELC